MTVMDEKGAIDDRQSFAHRVVGDQDGKSILIAKFFDDARGSAVECAACLDALVAKGLTVTTRILEGKTMLLRIVGMLTRLVARFDESAHRDRDEEHRSEDEGRERERERERGGRL